MAITIGQKRTHLQDIYKWLRSHWEIVKNISFVDNKITVTMQPYNGGALSWNLDLTELTIEEVTDRNTGDNKFVINGVSLTSEVGLWTLLKTRFDLVEIHD